MKIVVLGGGTAGWISASLVHAKHPQHDITVIESSKIGIIGVGESTTGLFTEIILNDLKHLGIDHDEFIKQTGASLKFGINHKHWNKNADSNYFGVLEGTTTCREPKDYMFAYLLTELPKEKMVAMTHTGYMINNKLSNTDKFGKFLKHGHAFHIDGVKSGQYFKNKCLQFPKIKCLDTEVVDVTLNDMGFISSLKLSNGENLDADFFIDCSGFAKVLIGKFSNEWISYKKYLPVDTGMPFLEQYQDGEIPANFTTAWAQKNGWLWQTPLLHRRGNGYAFDSNFITADKAQQEIETVLGRSINPIKILKFNAGRLKSAWIKNCVAVGLSYAFLEPLEGTGIHANIVQIKSFVDEFLGETKDLTITEGSINLYNKRVGQYYDDTKDFIAMHYMGGRTDSEFWKYISSGETAPDFVKDILSTAEVRMPSWNDFTRCWRGIGWELYCYVMAGIDRINIASAEKMLTPKIWNMLNLEYKNFQYFLKMEYQNHTNYDNFVNLFKLETNTKTEEKQYGK